MQIASEGLKGRVFEVSLADLQKVCFLFLGFYTWKLLNDTGDGGAKSSASYPRQQYSEHVGNAIIQLTATAYPSTVISVSWEHEC